jgi:hypothetical protein
LTQIVGDGKDSRSSSGSSMPPLLIRKQWTDPDDSYSNNDSSYEDTPGQDFALILVDNLFGCAITDNSIDEMIDYQLKRALENPT